MVAYLKVLEVILTFTEVAQSVRHGVREPAENESHPVGRKARGGVLDAHPAILAGRGSVLPSEKNLFGRCFGGPLCSPLGRQLQRPVHSGRGGGRGSALGIVQGLPGCRPAAAVAARRSEHQNNLPIDN